METTALFAKNLIYSMPNKQTIFHHSSVTSFFEAKGEQGSRDWNLSYIYS